MKLRNRNTYMTSLPEGHAPASDRSRITQGIYVLVLLILVVYIARIILSHLFTLEAPGFVEVDKHELSPAHGGHVTELAIRQNQHFTAGQPLIRLSPAQDCTTQAEQAGEQLGYMIARTRLKLNRTRQALNAARQRLPAPLDQALELTRGSFDGQQATRAEVARLTREASELRQEISLLGQQREAQIAHWRQGPQPAECREQQISAPFAGHVYEISKNKQEFVERGERLLTVIPDDAQVHIDFYSELDSLEHVQKGQIFTISFPDGSSSEGRVSSILSSAYQSPRWEREKYRPVTPQLRVRLIPLSAQSAAQWRQYDQLQVTVRGSK